MNADIGVQKVFDILRDEENRIDAIRHSLNTVRQGLDGWVEHFKYNLRRMPPEGRWVSETPVRRSVVCVGAGPSITDEQLAALKDYRGTIIATNKAAGRLYAMGVVPHYVTLLHPTDELLPHFANPVVRENLHRSTVVISSFTHPAVTDEILDHADKVVWYNCSVPECYTRGVDVMLARMSNHIVIDTGGNVGIFALVLAYEMGATVVGMLGMEHCIDPREVSGWTNEQAAGYYYHWAPEDDQFYCVTPLFRSYLLGLFSWYNKVRAEREGFELVNLTPFGPMYAQRRLATGVRYMEVSDFATEYD